MSQGNRRSRGYSTPSGLVKLAPYPIPGNRAPVSTDVGYAIGQTWVDIPSQVLYGLAAYENGGSVWQVLGGSIPTQNSYPITPYVVGTVGQAGYQTIQSALNAAGAAPGFQAIYVQPGTYTENLSVPSGVSIIAVDGNLDVDISTVIVGTHSLNGGGNIKFQGFHMRSSGDICTGGAGTGPLTFEDCTFDITVQGYIVNSNGDWTGEVYIGNCRDLSTGNNAVLLVAGPIFVNNSIIGSGEGTFLTVSPTRISLCVLGCNITSSESVLTLIDCITVNQAGVSTLNSGSASIEGCDIDGGVFCVGSGSLIIFASNIENNTDVGFAFTDFGAFSSEIIQSRINGQISHGSSDVLELVGTIINTASSPAIGGTGSGAVSIFAGGFQQNSTIAGTITLASSAALTPTVNTTQGAGTMRVASTTANAGDNAGFLQVIVNDSVAYIPYFTNIAP